jgi:hypothetical protein
MRLTQVTLCTAMLALCGCSVQRQDASRFREPIPQASDVEVSGPEAAASDEPGATATTAGHDDEPWAGGPWAKYYGFTRHVRDGVNTATAVILGGVWLVVHAEPSDLDDEQATWGPWTDSLSPASYRFRVVEVGEREYEYFLEGRPKSDSDAAWKAVLGGKGYGRRHSQHGDGHFRIDLDAAGALDPFEHQDDSGAVTIHHVLSTPDKSVSADVVPSEEEAWWSASSTRHADGAGTLRVSAFDDVDGSHATLLEDIVIDSRWRTDGAGRADVTISGGDVGDLVVTAVECWDTDFMRSYYSDSIDYEEGQGDESACAAF